MNGMIICGLSMEMELAEDMGLIGDCRMCLHLDGRMINKEILPYCEKNNELLDEYKSNCDDWVVDHR